MNSLINTCLPDAAPCLQAQGATESVQPPPILDSPFQNSDPNPEIKVMPVAAVGHYFQITTLVTSTW